MKNARAIQRHLTSAQSSPLWAGATLWLLGILLAGAGALAPTVQAQHVVRGTVVDAQEREAISGARVAVQGEQRATTTSPDGSYTIQVDRTGVLVVSFSGYEEREVSVNGRTEIEVALQPAGSPDAPATRNGASPIMDDVRLENPDQHLRSHVDAEGRETDRAERRESAREPSPPEGAQNHTFTELQRAELPRGARSPLRERLGVESGRPALEFSSGTYRPDPGLGADMQERLPALRDAGRSEVYGFVLLNDVPSPATFQELADRGVRILGRHGDALKVSVPLDAAQDVAASESVYWLGFSRPQQRVGLYLQRLMEEADTLAADRVPESVPLFINVFEQHDEGAFRSQLEDQGVEVGDFDPDLNAYRAMAPWGSIEDIVRFDFVLFVEPLLRQKPDHDESASLIGADYVRPGATNGGYDGSSVTVGILDSGFMLGDAAATMHVDLNKFGCGSNFTSERDAFDDLNGHGTHVLGTISGEGIGEQRYLGIAPGLGGTAEHRVRAAKVFCAQDDCGSDVSDAMDWMGSSSLCGSPRPSVVNYSGGYYGGIPRTGTLRTSREVDTQTWDHRQLYVTSSGNDGPDPRTVGRPAAAKTAMAVGNVFDNGYEKTGTINDWSAADQVCADDVDGDGTQEWIDCGSSRGPTRDGRMKPNVVAPGTVVESADAGTNDGYANAWGTSMAAPHVSGLAATLADHYPAFKGRPQLMRAYLMATATLHDDDTNLREGTGNVYGFGRVSSYLSHWARNNPDGWMGYWAYGGIDFAHFLYNNIEVPADADRLKVVMTWDEPAASAGAAQARIWNVGLVLDQGSDCPSERQPACGEYVQTSQSDNTIYAIIEDPEPGRWKLKAVPGLAPFNIDGLPFNYALPTAITANVIRGDTEPDLDLTVTPSTTTPAVGETFEIRTTVETSSYVASGAHLENTGFPGYDFRREHIQLRRKDGVSYEFSGSSDVTLGNVIQGDRRTATWSFTPQSEGCEDFTFRAWSENTGTVTETVTICP